MKRYRIGNNCYWYEDGKQPENAVLADEVKKVVETKEKVVETKEKVVEKKATTPRNKAKGVTTK